jgi:hypothetical protein
MGETAVRCRRCGTETEQIDYGRGPELVHKPERPWEYWIHKPEPDYYTRIDPAEWQSKPPKHAA